MAYDPATRTMLLFGGHSNRYPYLGDTWIWNGTTWIKLSPSTSPLARTDAPIAYDAATRTALLFGGEGMLSEGEYGGLSDTWSWNGTTWTKLFPPTNPGGSDSDSMAYDPATGTVLLFNGGCCNPGLGQTWSWNGTTWTRPSPPTSPPLSGGSSMAYDQATATVLLLLGDDYGFDQTWSWNGTTWTKLSPPTSPPVSGGWSMAYDPATATVLLFGGISSDRTSTRAMSPVVALGETWSWNGTTWTKLSPATSPAARYGASMAYDPGTEAMLLFGDVYDGEFNDTWTLRDPSPPPAATSAVAGNVRPLCVRAEAGDSGRGSDGG